MVFALPQAEVNSDSDPPSIPTYSSPSDLKLKQRLRETASSLMPTFSPLEQTLSPILFNYYDTLFCERAAENADSLRRMACLHAVNHIFKYASSLCPPPSSLLLPPSST